jgi:hypothetical protein
VGLNKYYGSNSKLSLQIKNVHGKFNFLEMKESIVGDAAIQVKINLLTNGFNFWFDLIVFEICNYFVRKGISDNRF